MKKMFVYGTAVLALSAAPLLAQQTSGGGTARPGSATTQPGTPGATRSGASDQGGATQGGTRSAAPAASQAEVSKGANADHAFVMEAAMGSMSEVELGHLASDKAQSEQVKQFAERMVTDHGKANDELKTLAQSKNISLPSDSGAKHKATKDRLSKLSGAAFDRAYMQEMVTDHRKDVSEFQKESKSGKDGDVKAWAAKTLPTLQEHLQMAQTASRSAVGTSGTKASPDTDKATGGSTPRTGGTSSTPGGSPTTPRTGGSGSSATPSGGSTSSPGSATGSSSPR